MRWTSDEVLKSVEISEVLLLHVHHCESSTSFSDKWGDVLWDDGLSFFGHEFYEPKISIRLHVTVASSEHFVIDSCEKSPLDNVYYKPDHIDVVILTDATVGPESQFPLLTLGENLKMSPDILPQNAHDIG